MYMYRYVSGDLKVLVGICKKLHIACISMRSRKFRDSAHERKAYFLAKVLRTACRQDIRVQVIPRKISDSSAVVTSKENASTIGSGQCPGNGELQA